MYLTEPQFTDVVKKQIRYKWNAYSGVFSSLLIMQMIGFFFGLGTGGGSHGSESIDISFTFSSGDSPAGFTFLWAFSMGILVTTLAYRNDAFTFVTNRLSHHLSSFLFLILASVIGGITAVLSSSFIKFISLFRDNMILIESVGLFDAPGDFFLRIVTSIAYTILFAGIGYAIGSFIQRSKLVIPVIVIVLFILPMFNSLHATGLIEKVVAFYGTETSFLVFLVKVVVTVLVLFGISVTLTNRLEVRK